MFELFKNFVYRILHYFNVSGFYLLQWRLHSGLFVCVCVCGGGGGVKKAFKIFKT